MVIGYLVISIVVCYISYNWLKDSMNEKLSRGSYKYTILMDTSEAWIISVTSVFWIIAVPIIILWKTLDFINNKLFKK